MSKREPRLYAPAAAWRATTSAQMYAQLQKLALANPEKRAEAVLQDPDAPRQAKELARELMAQLPALRAARKRDSDAVAVGMAVGRAYEKMRTVAAFGREAIAGAAQRQGGRKAGAAKRAAAHGTDTRLTEACKRLKKLYPRETQTQLQRRIAEEFGMSPETVRRHLYRLGLGRGRRGRPPGSTAKTRT